MKSYRIRTAMLASAILFLYFRSSSAQLLAEPPRNVTAQTERKPSGDCQPASAGAMLDCVLQNHPELRVLTGEIKKLEAEIIRAGQRPNPEMDSRILGGEASFMAEAGISHTFETAGKREARISVAKENLAVARSRISLEKQRIVLDSALDLVRLRHLFDEATLLESAEQTYTRAIGRIRSRPALSSELRVNLATYEMAAADTGRRSVILRTEAKRLMTHLHLASGVGIQRLESALPNTARLKWPDPGEPQSTPKELQLARSRAARARAELQLEEANAYPNLSIGPALEYRQSDDRSSGLFGGSSRRTELDVGLSFRITLPLFHTNHGGQASARATVETEHSREAHVAQKVTSIRRSLIVKYRDSVESLKRTLSGSELNARQRNLRKAILSGRVSPPAVIEFHRSMFEYVNGRHKQELAALNALLAIYALDGRLLEKVKNHEVF
jgi:outer membrane protein TolC